MLNTGVHQLDSYLPSDLVPAKKQPSERILIVDDEPIIRDILTKIVGSAGFETGTAENGQEALERLTQVQYHMVLTDLRMPKMTGLDLLQHIAAHYEDVAVIMITAVSDASTAIDALSAGAYDYVIKPFNATELRNKIVRGLERRRLILDNKEYQCFLEQRVQEQTADLKSALRQIESAYSETLEALINALDAREHETQRHSKRVSEYTLLLARSFGITQSQMLDIQRGSLLHDIGKIGISDNILLKPGKLNKEEWVEIKKHPQIGYNILKGIHFLDGPAQLVLQHHEKFDGSGYPQALEGQNIMIGARIFAVVDTFDAMTSDRPYRKALTYQIAREEIIRFSGIQFDPEIVECFLEIPEEIWFRTKTSLRR